MRNAVMDLTNKIVWAEGLLLGQQHLQLWEQCFREEYNRKLIILKPWFWGLLEIKIDMELLSYGKFKLNYCSLCFKNQCLINYDENDNELLMLSLNDYDENIISMYVVMPCNNKVANISGYEQQDYVAAWSAHYVDSVDFYDSERHREIIIARPNLQLVTDISNYRNYESIKIAEVIRQQNGIYELNKDYIPTVLQIKTSKGLLDKLNCFLLYLQKKIAQVEKNRKNVSLLKTYYQAMILLKSIHVDGLEHPQYLYKVLLQLFAELMAHADIIYDSFPTYIHDELTDTFAGLIALIKKQIDVIVPKSNIHLYFNKTDENKYSIKDINIECFQYKRWYLAVKNINIDVDTIIEFVKQMKLGSSNTIDNIIVSALSGLDLQHITKPMQTLIPNENYCYFQLLLSGAVWQAICNERDIVANLTKKFCDAELEMIILTQ